MNSFENRHIGPQEAEIKEMLATVGFKSLDELSSQAVPEKIHFRRDLQIEPALSERESLDHIRKVASQNEIWRSYIGTGYYGTHLPSVIQRTILENPGWYTQYTPYQPEISQGRLEALLNYQTMIIDLTGLPITNASLLDEATAAAEAMYMCLNMKKNQGSRIFFVSELCHPQTIAVLKTRAEPLGIEVRVGDHKRLHTDLPVLGALVQYPATDGSIYDYSDFAQKVHASGGYLAVASDLLALTMIKSPAQMGADICLGSAQRFGVPMGYGGPHAAFLSCKEEFKRILPGRIVGLSIDSHGRPAARLALQTREQHIRREKATSNICTAQVLLAIISGMYAVYHGPQGLRSIAQQIHIYTKALREALRRIGYLVGDAPYFDTVKVGLVDVRPEEILDHARKKKINLRSFGSSGFGISLDETTSVDDLQDLIEIFATPKKQTIDIKKLLIETTKLDAIPLDLRRTDSYLKHPVFHKYRSETEILRYIKRLEAKDLSLTTSMIPLGSCTMKLNAAAELMPITWPEINSLHPFVPAEQARGYQTLFKQLERWLAEITGFSAISLQPNAGSQGEYAGLLVIRKHFLSKGQNQRNVCLIPKSAHGTNPASATMAGMQVVVVDCDSLGNINVEDLRAKAVEHKDNLAAAMITYPSTHGVFEETVSEICKIVHDNGGQVYMDGANMNAQVGLCRPADIGADVCHLNLHKTFCIPHGGGGPGMGPIGVKSHLAPFLPSHPVVDPLTGQSDSGAGTITKAENGLGPVSAAPWGSASILPISWAYIAMMGSSGLKHATQVAILNANYIAKRLESYFPVLYKAKNGLIAHECILDVRQFKESAGIEVDDIAKRLMDYGFHAPTMSFPVAGTLMVEPTESESKAELDRFCDAMISIRKEIEEVEKNPALREDNVLKRAPFTMAEIISENWKHPYTREKAAFPASWTKEHKYWPAVSRVNQVHGDKNLICACPSIEAYS
ncbi:MAG: aminomethyl-transferring glycine dehydrogenase [Bacteriovoracia bacterium]